MIEQRKLREFKKLEQKMELLNVQFFKMILGDLQHLKLYQKIRIF